ncbi:hypothetical protein DM806_01760 [Sphingobium lactosutens]|nr:hypothetical protein [Sphingobium lactosutens]
MGSPRLWAPVGTPTRWRCIFLARSQGVATLASSFRDEDLIGQEVDRMCAWLHACVESAGPENETESCSGQQAEAARTARMIFEGV